MQLVGCGAANEKFSRFCAPLSKSLLCGGILGILEKLLLGETEWDQGSVSLAVAHLYPRRGEGLHDDQVKSFEFAFESIVQLIQDRDPPLDLAASRFYFFFLWFLSQQNIQESIYILAEKTFDVVNGMVNGDTVEISFDPAMQTIAFLLSKAATSGEVVQVVCH